MYGSGKGDLLTVVPVNESLDTKSVKYYFKLATFIFSVLCISIFVTLHSTNSNASSQVKLGEVSPKFQGASFDLEVSVVSPDYGATDISLLPWDAVAEPFRAQTIYITKLAIDGTEMTVDDYDISWEIDGSKYSGNGASFVVKKTAVLTATVAVVSKSGAVEMSREFSLAVKYIRRELRSLTDADREAYFAALYKLYTVDAATGVSLYGSKFRTAEQQLWKHLNGAGTSDCDHWHDGAGIATHHIAYTLEVEQALQAVDPTVAMSYWEFTLDTITGKPYSSSEIFYPDWFGEANPVNSEKAIRDGGMWEGITMPDGNQYKEWDVAATGTLNPFVNAYGVMRSPWNNNPSPYIGRHNATYSVQQYSQFPTCSVMRNCFLSESLAEVFVMHAV